MVFKIKNVTFGMCCEFFKNFILKLWGPCFVITISLLQSFFFFYVFFNVFGCTSWNFLLKISFSYFYSYGPTSGNVNFGKAAYEDDDDVLLEEWIKEPPPSCWRMALLILLLLFIYFLIIYLFIIIIRWLYGEFDGSYGYGDTEH